jgi:hypothetical protein
MVMKNILLLVLLVLPLALLGCSQDAVPVAPAPAAGENLVADGPPVSPSSVNEVSYTYTGYSRTGIPVVRGFLHLTRLDSVRFAGRWELRPLGDTTRIGPQHGRGRLSGTLRGGILHVNLNPGNVDNNVFLTGRFDRRSFTGRWEWIGFPGVINSGSFVALRGRLAVD